MCQLFQYADLSERKSRQIKKDVRRGDYSSLTDYLLLVKTYLKNSTERFGEFEKAYADAVALYDQTAIAIGIKKAKAKTKQTVTQVVGGATAGAAIAGGVTTGVVVAGVATSVVAGVFTFGIGTVVGLAITGAGAGAVAAGGVGAGVVTGLLARKFKRVVKAFKKMSKDMERLDVAMTGLGEIVSSMEITLAQIGGSTGVVEEVKCKVSPNNLILTFEISLGTIRDGRAKLATYVK